MSFDNARKRNFQQLDWYNPLTWFGQPSIPPPYFDPTTQWQTPLPSKSTDNSIMSMNSFDAALRSNFVAPFKKVDNAVVSDVEKIKKAVVSDVDKIKNELTTVKDGIVTGFRDIKDEFAYVGSEVKIGFEKTEQGIVWGYTNIVKPLAIDTITLLESTVSTINWLVANRTLVLVAVGSYGAFRFINEAKMAIK